MLPFDDIDANLNLVVSFSDGDRFANVGSSSVAAGRAAVSMHMIIFQG